MDDIFVWDPTRVELLKEKVYFKRSLLLIYRSPSFWGAFFRTLFCKSSFCSLLYGFYQKMPWTRSKIGPFVAQYGVNLQEFEEKKYNSFNDFFIRKIKAEARPLANSPLICPADGRYQVYHNIERDMECFVKGKRLSLFDLFGQNAKLVEKYVGGTCISIRLAPPDYHRFHMPVTGTPSAVVHLGHTLYSVNPIALRWDLNAITQNKRAYTIISTPDMGDILLMAIGATNVGSIHFNLESGLQPGKELKAGADLGYFSFGGSRVDLYLPLEAKIKIALAENLTELGGVPEIKTLATPFPPGIGPLEEGDRPDHLETYEVFRYMGGALGSKESLDS